MHTIKQVNTEKIWLSVYYLLAQNLVQMQLRTGLDCCYQRPHRGCNPLG